jgi:hypothetical protein
MARIAVDARHGLKKKAHGQQGEHQQEDTEEWPPIAV